MAERGFGSDNHSPIHPIILKKISEVNTGHAPSYGTDEWTEKALEVFKKHFGSDSQTFFVFNGTAANVLALRSLTKPFHSIFCSDLSHINMDECAAPEFFTHCKLIDLPSINGKITLDSLEKNWIRRGDQHYAQTQVLSLTQPTEMGTVYHLDELKKIAHWCKERKVAIHMDGARIANACYFLDTSFSQITREIGVDVVSFGGTKNGLMFGEAVVFLNSKLAEDFKYIRKQSAQLPSKSRFVAAQFLAYFENDLWKDIAEHSHKMATKLAELVHGIPGVEITQKVESNGVFATIPQSWVKPLREKYFFYVWDEITFECRWMCSWDTKEEDIIGFAKALKELSRETSSH